MCVCVKQYFCQARPCPAVQQQNLRFSPRFGVFKDDFQPVFFSGVFFPPDALVGCGQMGSTLHRHGYVGGRGRRLPGRRLEQAEGAQEGHLGSDVFFDY